jgi:two-component system OmpR family sensor kinase/two-component system sensor histidine kinase BaeS
MLGCSAGFFLVFLIGLTIILALLYGPLAEWLRTSSWALAGLCAAALLFAILMAAMAGWAFRRVGRPTVDVLAAIDAVAGGDFGIRVREDVPGEFGRLARRFNYMVTELERAEQQRRNLTADVAHELRNPLHIIQGNLEGMLDGVYAATPEQIEATLEETRLLARLVEDLQTLSLAEAGQLPLHHMVFSVADLLADVATSFGVEAEDANVELRIDVPKEGNPLELNADPDRLDQVLSNLVSNALRYTPAGGQIMLQAERIPQGVRLSVEDTGEGIPAEDLPHIFDRFWRGDRARARQGEGDSGLGLAIARQLVQAHGGQISVESQVGRGTRFVIEMPVAAIE